MPRPDLLAIVNCNTDSFSDPHDRSDVAEHLAFARGLLADGATMVDLGAQSATTDIPAEDRMKVLRLIENMTLGRNAVGYLTESLHGAGSPQAQRIQIARQMQVETKKRLAKKIAGIDDSAEPEEEGGYFDRVLEPPE